MKDGKTCGAKTRNGTPCKRAPMANGRCKLHGGASKRGAEHGRFKHGRYSKYVSQEILAKMDADSTDPLDLLPELQIQRASFADYIDKLQGKPLSTEAIALIMDWSTEITKTVERIVKIRNETALTGAEVAFLAARISDVIGKYIPDEQKQRAFIEELFNSSEVPGLPQSIGATNE